MTRRCPPLPSSLICTILVVLTSNTWIASTAGADTGSEPPSATDSLGLWTGEYRHAGGAEEEHALAALVDEMARGFNVLLRPIARRRLEKTVVVPERIEIITDEAGLSVRAVGAADLPDAPVLEDGAIVVRQSSFEGKRETSFRLRPDGSVLVMHVTTTSALLPDLLEYQLTFERVRPGLADSMPAPAVPVSGPAPLPTTPGPSGLAGGGDAGGS